MKTRLRGALASALLAATAVSVQAASIDVNLAGWQTFSDFGDPTNTSVLLNVGAGSTITGFDYLNLTYTTSGESWLSEFVLSVNNATASEFIDWAPSLTDAGGTFGPASGSWNGPTGIEGPFGPGAAPFTVTDGVLFVTAYESFDDDGLDATVTAGTLRIFYTPVASAIPEPSTYALMAFGLLGLGAVARRRRD